MKFRNPKPVFRMLFFLLMCVATGNVLYAQCSSSGNKNPTTATDVSFTGSSFAFSNPDYSLISDNNRATASAVLALLTGQTNYLQTTNFNFAIPSKASICGIELQIQRSATGIGKLLGIEVAWVNDNIVRLLKGNVLTGSNYATASHWSSTDTYITYGGSADLWGTTWTPADINATNFGMAFSASITGVVALLPSVRINDVRINVYYSLPTPLPVILTKFDVAATGNNTATLQWKTDNEDPGTVFTIQRSIDGVTWQNVTSIPGISKNIPNTSYTAEDRSPYSYRTWYRLHVRSDAGEDFYSSIKTVTFRKNSTVQVFPNPFTSYIQISNLPPTGNIIVTDIYGRQVLSKKVNTSGNERLNMEGLSAGAYFITTGHETIKVQKQ